MPFQSIFLPQGRFSLVGTVLVLMGLCLMLIQVLGLDLSATLGNRDGLSLGSEPWRLLTAGFMHANVVHGLVMLSACFGLSMWLEKDYGKTKALAILLGSAVSGAITSAVMQHQFLSMGMDASVWGIIGLIFSRILGGKLGLFDSLPAVFIGLALLVWGVIAPMGFGLDLWLALGGFMAGLMMSPFLKPLEADSTSIEMPTADFVSESRMQDVNPDEEELAALEALPKPETMELNPQVELPKNDLETEETGHSIQPPDLT